jgi:outer membrane protein assembly factor BamD (BamD/ComL family)
MKSRLSSSLSALAAVALVSVQVCPAWAETLLEAQNRRAAALFEKARRDQDRSALSSALERFDLVVKNYPRTSWAGRAQWEIARLYDENNEYEEAFDAYQLLIDHFAGYFENSLNAQFRLAMRLLEVYERTERVPGVPLAKGTPEKKQLSEMFRIIIKNGPYADSVAEAHYYLGVAYEKEGKIHLARDQHIHFLEKYPKHPLADDASYQSAYIDFKHWRTMKSSAPQSRDVAETGLKYFLVLFPESDKAARARECLSVIDQARRTELLETAKFYENNGNEKAAAVYYFELADRHPEIGIAVPSFGEKILALKLRHPDLVKKTAPPSPQADVGSSMDSLAPPAILMDGPPADDDPLLKIPDDIRVPSPTP